MIKLARNRFLNTSILGAPTVSGLRTSNFELRTLFLVKAEWTDVKRPNFELRTLMFEKTEWTEPNGVS